MNPMNKVTQTLYLLFECTLVSSLYLPYILKRIRHVTGHDKTLS